MLIEYFGEWLVKIGERIAGYRRVHKVIVHVDSEEILMDYLCNERLV